ncbi:MAG: 50S ribosomal protein L32 [Bacillota bacterium]|nr:50S ribosomal protein L32 [Bacillota bacterium]OPL15036.1 MAG: 50S ribosomal protein L32 [Firmicutes bacterium ML8_F2]
MAVPKRRTSKSKRNMRRSQDKLSVPHLVPCPQCHELKPAHRVCLNCGYYKGREAVKVN